MFYINNIEVFLSLSFKSAEEQEISYSRTFQHFISAIYYFKLYISYRRFP